MSLNYQEIYTKIKIIGEGVNERKRSLDERKKLALRLFNQYADDISNLRSKVEEIKQVEPGIRCALPVNEILGTHQLPPPLPEKLTLIAADGSQINPDRHAPIQFGVVNVGAIVLRMNSGTSPLIKTDSDLLFDDELFHGGVPITDGIVALKRDLAERKKLDDLASEFGSPGESIITFTDGPIELWGAKDGADAEAFYESLKSYKAVLSRLQSRGVTTAGYVDKPGADLVIRLLELMEFEFEQGQSKELREHHPLLGVSDRWLFGQKGNLLLKSGERSAVFAIQSKSEKQYQGVLALHFFYINVGTVHNPWIVRVEIPKWVADDAEKLGMLHAVLVDQCRQMGSKPYPYLLHRAHEAAVVTHEEKYQVEQMLQMELRRYGGDLDEGSNKQFHKDQSGRTSYK